MSVRQHFGGVRDGTQLASAQAEMYAELRMIRWADWLGRVRSRCSCACQPAPLIMDGSRAWYQPINGGQHDVKTVQTTGSLGALEMSVQALTVRQAFLKHTSKLPHLAGDSNKIVALGSMLLLLQTSVGSRPKLIWVTGFNWPYPGTLFMSYFPSYISKTSFQGAHF